MDDNGGLIWQVSHNEPMTRLLLDDSVNNKGYVAISTVHFDQNFLFWLSYLNQYRHQLAFIALQDFHGSESWWWANELVHYRTLFLASEPTYEGMLRALEERRVVTIRHDKLTGYETRILGGTAGVQDYILSRKEEWKWWDDETREMNHPWASVAVLQADDKFEEERPDFGVNIRIRCWWEGPRQFIQQPVVELIRLEVNNRSVQTKYIESENQSGNLTDVYHLYSWSEIQPGEHMIKATVRNKNTNTEQVISYSFEYQ